MRPNEVHIWMSRRPPPGIAPIPSGWTYAELRRYAGLQFEQDRSRGIARRGLLRRVVARYLGCQSSEVELTVRPGGKPELRWPNPNDLAFSISSSHDLVLVVIASGMEVGVDVERVCALPELSRLATIVLNDAEHEAQPALASGEQTRWLLQRWTAKEAVLKASGVGLSVDPRDVFVVRRGNETVARVGEAEWSVTELAVDQQYVATVASERRVETILQFEDAW
ncbi:MAG: 4'-phosphopantetheinyl transferase superfamily protein [Planctomycetaceae bacterium]|nr:4'-phosphopantetheinyl transferase superfamily protein [Planctomycetaceae bacterium]